jgi:hypothetical protein
MQSYEEEEKQLQRTIRTTYSTDRSQNDDSKNETVR